MLNESLSPALIADKADTFFSANIRSQAVYAKKFARIREQFWGALFRLFFQIQSKVLGGQVKKGPLGTGLSSRGSTQR